MIKTRNELKGIFTDGAYPDQQDYHDALDSYVHKDDQISPAAIEGAMKIWQLWLAESQFAEADLAPTGILEQAEQTMLPQSNEGDSNDSEGEGSESNEGEGSESNESEGNESEGNESEDDSNEGSESNDASAIEATFLATFADLNRRIVYVQADGLLLPSHDLPQAYPAFADLGQTSGTQEGLPETVGSGFSPRVSYALTRADYPDAAGRYTYTLTLYGQPLALAAIRAVCAAFFVPVVNELFSSI